MAFAKKTWKDRIAEFPTRRRLTKEDNTSELVTVAREEGTLSQEGDAFSAENMNDLENRIDAEFTEVNGKLQKEWSTLLDTVNPSAVTSYNLLDSIDNYTEIKLIWWMPAGQSKNNMQIMTYDYEDISDQIGNASMFTLANSLGTNNTGYYCVTYCGFISKSTLKVNAVAHSGYSTYISFKILAR